MTRQRIINICLIASFALTVFYVNEKRNSEEWQSNPGYMLVAIIALATITGVVAVIFVLPALGDAVSTAMLSSGEKITEDEPIKAAAKIASGDYEGAIEEYKKALVEKPDDPFPISEIAKIYDDRLGETEQALAFLQQHLEERDWSPDHAAFLMFRMVDVNLHAGGFDAAREILERVMMHFPETRHSANARHKINEIEELQYKARQAQRTNPVQPGETA